MTDSQIKKEYLRRICKVQDYIEDHLYDSLSLEELSNIAGFSKFHFHRIFKAIEKETLSQYVNRLKLEGATSFLIHRTDMTVTDIAHYFGFTDSAVFSRAFKNYYKISPIKYRNNYSKNCKEPYKISQYNRYISKLKSKNNREVKGEIEILELDNVNTAYIRYTGSYGNLASHFPKIVEKLFEYANEQNLIELEKTKILAIYHDNPQFTQEHHLRTSICMTIPDNIVVKENSDLGNMTIPSGKYLVGHFSIFQNEYSDAWDFMYNEWLSNDEHKLRNSFPFEVYLNDPNSHPQNKHIVDIYLPIESF
ncbi:AraC family transcriptional regulator [Clostridioides difficile]